MKGKFLKSQISGMKAWMQRTETSVSFSAVDTDNLGAGADRDVFSGIFREVKVFSL